MRSISTKSNSEKTEEFEVSEIDNASNTQLPDNETQSTSQPATPFSVPLSTSSSSTSLKTIAPLSQISLPPTTELETVLSNQPQGAFCYFAIRDFEDRLLFG